MKKYNNQTGCYKIDLFINGSYFCSTAQSKTCKEAKEKLKTKLQNKSKFLPLYIDVENLEQIKISAFFDKI